MNAVTHRNALVKVSAAVLLAAIAFGVYATTASTSRAKSGASEVTLTQDGTMKMTVTAQRPRNLAATAQTVSGPAPLAKDAASI